MHNKSFTTQAQAQPMRSLTLLLLLALAGCASMEAPAGGFVAADAATVPVLGRGIGDTVYSAVTGKDCSIVRLDEGKTYCRKTAPPPARPPFCTRTLGTINCWKNPKELNGPPRYGVADGPATLTPAQEANRTARWPPL